VRRYRCTASSLKVRAAPNGEDTGARLTRGQIVPAQGQSFDAEWLFVDAGERSGWASALYLEREKDDEPLIATPPVPKGRSEIEEIFGQAANPMASVGKVTLPEPLKLGWSDERVSSFRCHAKLADVFTIVFRRIHEAGLWPELRTFDGCYNNRKIGGTQKPSTHAWGIAVDLNAATNRQGKKGDMHPGIVEIFEQAGFTWGGRWTNTDPMHFEWTRKT
jgi:hypothetical protein